MIPFDRCCRVTVTYPPTKGTGMFIEDNPKFFDDGLVADQIEGNIIKFKTVRSIKSAPNTCEISIYNLAPSSRAKMVRTPLRVRLEAGHSGVFRLLFVGDARPGTMSIPSAVEWETKLVLGDGLRAFAQARKSATYSAGTPFKVVIRDAARSFGLELPENVANDPALGFAIPTAEYLHGWIADELTRLLAPYGYEWSIQNGKLQILRAEEVNRAQTHRVVDADNMMIGSPIVGVPDKTGKQTITAKRLIDVESHGLNPGDRIELRSITATGMFKIEQVTEEGDMGSETWDATYELTKTS